MQHFSRRSLLSAGCGAVALFVIGGCSPAPADKAESSPATGPSTEAVASEPAYALLTLPVGKSGPADYAAQLGAARTSGQVADVLLVRSKPSAEGPLGFDSFALLTFKDEASFASWSRDAAPKLGADVSVKRADLLVDERAASPSPTAAYVVHHYTSLITPDAYKKYTVDYIGPNMDGQKAKGVLNGYAMFYEREPAGTPSKAVLVKEYKSEAAFERSLTLSEIKAELMKKPDWKAINDTKDQIRTDIASTLATPVAIP